VSEDGDHTNRGEEHPHEAVYRERVSDGLAWRTTFLILGGAIGLLTFFWSVLNGIQESSRAEIRNVEARCLNANTATVSRLQNTEDWIRECCGRRR
jgi:hypothetical protein